MSTGALLMAAETGDTAAARALLAEGADVNERTAHGDTALMRAAANGSVETALLLLDAGADVNARAGSGMTALARAAFFGHAEMVRALLGRGADPNLADRTGMTALDWALAKGETEVVNILKGFPASSGPTSANRAEVRALAAPEENAGARAETPGPEAEASDPSALARPAPRRQPPPPTEQDAESEVTQVAARARPRPHTGEDLTGEDLTEGVFPPPAARAPEDSPPYTSSDLLKQAGLFVVLTLCFAALTWVIFERMEVFTPRAPSTAPPPAEERASGDARPAANETPNQGAALPPARPRSDDEGLTTALSDWVAATNAQDVERQMGFYADRLHTYYRSRNVTRGFVRREKVGVFAKARKVQVSAGVPEIEYGEDGLTARMRFRKAYFIDGGPGARRGEVVQELFWRQTEDGWKIVGERDARVVR